MSVRIVGRMQNDNPLGEHVAVMIDAAARLGVDRELAEDLARNGLSAWMNTLCDMADRRGLRDEVAHVMAVAADEDLRERADAIGDAARQRRAVADLARAAAATRDPERMRKTLLSIAGVISGDGFEITPARNGEQRT